MVNYEHNPTVGRIADAAINAARAKKGPAETRRRVIVAITPLARELVEIGVNEAVVAVDKHKQALRTLPIPDPLPRVKGLFAPVQSFPPKEAKPMRYAPWAIAAVLGAVIAVLVVFGVALWNGALEMGGDVLGGIANGFNK